MMGHLNSFSASGGGNLSKNFPKIQMPGGLPGGGMLKLRFDWYIRTKNIHISCPFLPAHSQSEQRIYTSSVLSVSASAL